MDDRSSVLKPAIDDALVMSDSDLFAVTRRKSDREDEGESSALSLSVPDRNVRRS